MNWARSVVCSTLPDRTHDLASRRGRLGGDAAGLRSPDDPVRCDIRWFQRLASPRPTLGIAGVLAAGGPRRRCTQGTTGFTGLTDAVGAATRVLFGRASQRFFAGGLFTARKSRVADRAGAASGSKKAKFDPARPQRAEVLPCRGVEFSKEQRPAPRGWATSGGGGLPGWKAGQQGCGAGGLGRLNTFVCSRTAGRGCQSVRLAHDSGGLHSLT